MSPFPRRRESGVLVFRNLLERGCRPDGSDSRLCGNLGHSGLRSEESLPAQKIGRFFGKQAVAFVVGVDLVGTQLTPPEDF